MVQKILVLDDEEHYAEMLKTLLEQHHFVVNTVTRADAAIAELQKDGHELVISDFKMPSMDGASFLEKARQVNPDVPFILVSGLMNTPELVKVANMGVTLVLEKPINVDFFIEQVKRFVKPMTKAEFEAYTKGLQQPEEESSDNIEDTLELTYPKNLQYLSGFSHHMERFLQHLWQGVEAEENLCVSFFPEAEIELVLRELAVWKQRSTHSTRMLPASSVGTPEFAEKLNVIQAEVEGSGIVGILGFAALDDEQQSNCLDFILNPQSVCPQLESLTFVFFVEELVLQNPLPGYNEDLLEVFQQKACHLPPLCHKLVDLGVYIFKYLDLIARKEGFDSKTEIEPQAVDLLLAYHWPRNFGELISVLRRAVLLGRNGPLTAEELTVILKRTGAAPPDPKKENNLEAILLQKQGEYLRELLQKNSCDMSTLFDKIGLDKVAVNDTESVDELHLLFPDLLQINAQQN